MMQKRQGMLLVLPVPFRIEDGRLLLEIQACNGLERWADNFGTLTIAAPVMPEQIVSQNPTMVWKDSTTLAEPDRFKLVPLPWAYSPREFAIHYKSVKTLLADLIDRCEYLQFAISCVWGDWAAVAALEANKQNRPYAIHTDRVDYKVILQIHQDRGLLKRAKANVVSRLTQHYHQWIIRRCRLGLWHGEDCYQAYSPFCSNSHLIHDIHTKPEDGITPKQLSAKLKQLATDPVLRICYTGRIAPMKAPLDWVRAIAHAKALGVKLEAVWLGEGLLREEMNTLITELGVDDCIQLAGFERDRRQVLQRIRDSHLMLFTHVTPESPRCLIESLIGGTPIIGYHSPYAEDLLKDYGGGQLVPVHDWRQLGEQLKELASDRERLATLVQQAALSGSRFNDEAVFRERSHLIMSHLGTNSEQTMRPRELIKA